jgi:uncharacterized membrane protein YdjX (TVP38/TMEM64 family)
VNRTTQALLVVLCLGAGLSLTLFTPVPSYVGREHVVELRQWLLSFGRWTPVLFVSAFLLATLFGIPATPFTLSAGSLFGVRWGLGYALLASNLAANLAFGISRVMGERIFARWFSRPSLNRIRKLLSQRGIEVVFTLRVLPLIPFVVFNYLAGLSPVRWTDYAIGSLLGMVPSTVIYVTLGSAVFDVNWRDPRSWMDARIWAPLGLATLALVATRWYLSRKGVKLQ